ncbi:unnamed protein product [Ectocarpus fasciculatus]
MLVLRLFVFIGVCFRCTAPQAALQPRGIYYYYVGVCFTEGLMSKRPVMELHAPTAELSEPNHRTRFRHVYLREIGRSAPIIWETRERQLNKERGRRHVSSPRLPKGNPITNISSLVGPSRAESMSAARMPQASDSIVQGVIVWWYRVSTGRRRVSNIGRISSVKLEFP